MSGRPRLPCRDRQALLQACPTNCCARSRGADQPPRPSRSSTAANGSPAISAACNPHRYQHHCRPHAERASALPRLDPRTHSPRSCFGRSRYGGAVDVILRSRPHPGAGLPLLHRHPRPGQTLRRRARRCRLHPRAGSRHPLLHLGRRHSEEHREHASAAAVEAAILIHENIRGPGYYH